MAEFVKLNLTGLKELRQVNPMMMSYNVEFAEVTGGTFWKAYTPGQVAGTEPFVLKPANSYEAMMGDLMQMYPPIDLYDERIRKLAREFGPVWVPPGAVFPVPGPPRPTTTLTAPPAARPRRAI